MSSAPPSRAATTTPGLLQTFASVSTPAARCPVRRRPLFTLFPLTFLSTTSLLADTPPWGFFSGRPKFELLDGGRKIKLLEDFSYTDPQARAWVAPAGWIVDGASIPGAFGSIIGGPLDGPYRNAAIIHDVACDQKTAPWEDVHLTFYHALRCGGVGEIEAKILYYAVYQFGPRWGFATGLAEIFSAVGFGDENMRPFVAEESAIEIATWIEKTNPSLAELQATKPTAAPIKTRRSDDFRDRI